MNSIIGSAVAAQANMMMPNMMPPHMLAQWPPHMMPPMAPMPHQYMAAGPGGLPMMPPPQMMPPRPLFPAAAASVGQTPITQSKPTFPAYR